jgi:GNAT superfamily N-acetyltransferase
VLDAASVAVTNEPGPSRLKLYQHGSDGTPCDGIWLALDGDKLLGHAVAWFPRRQNTDAVELRGAVHPAHQRQGIGRALHEAVQQAADEAGRTKLYTGTVEGGAGMPALEALGYRPIHTHLISRLAVHDAPWGRWDRMYDEAAARATDYELVRRVGPTPEADVAGVVELFDAINDAPMSDPDAEPDAWTADRVRAYAAAMVARRQTVHQVMARHRKTGAWVGHTVLCIDEFDPGVAHQEDTSVVSAHRGHRLGVLLKLEMLRWIARDRPEVRATETWNSAENHHMLAVNEALGTTVVARHRSMRLG